MLAAFAKLSMPAKVELLLGFFSTALIYPTMLLARDPVALDEAVTYYGFFALPVIWCIAAAISPARISAIAFFGGVAIYATAIAISVILSSLRIGTGSGQTLLDEGVLYSALQGALWAAGWVFGLVIRAVWMAIERLRQPAPPATPAP